MGDSSSLQRTGIVSKKMLSCDCDLAFHWSNNKLRFVSRGKRNKFLEIIKKQFNLM